MTNRPFAPREIDHLVLRVRDLGRMLAFYCEVIGCTVERRRDAIGLVQLRAGRSLIDLVPVDGPLGRQGGAAPGAQGRNMDHLCLRVEPFDANAIRAHLARCGLAPGEVATRYGAEGMGPSIYVTDPEGNVVELKGPASTSRLFLPEPSRRGIRIALGLSIAAHALVLALPAHEPIQPPGPIAGVPGPMTVVLAAPTPPAEAVLPQPAPELPRPRARPDTAPPRPAPRASPEPEAPESPPAPPGPPFDMLALVNANRERRRAAEAAARPRGEPAAPPAPAPEADQGIASLNRNLQTLTRGFQGTSGVFQILRMGPRTAEFSFNGWRPEANRRWREVIEVDAGPGGDVELAVIRRMIELIRGHYSGDFNWESHRLGRVVVLSARPADSEALEDFLAREFFGTPILNRRDAGTARR